LASLSGMLRNRRQWGWPEPAGGQEQGSWQQDCQPQRWRRQSTMLRKPSAFQRQREQLPQGRGTVQLVSKG
jgi:hypothetical protein